MRKRIRNMLALLICFSMIAAESSVAFAEKGVTEAEASTEDVQILGTGSGTVSGYTITGDLEYGRTTSEFTPITDGNPWKITDEAGNEVKDYRLKINSLTYNGKEYSYGENGKKVATFYSAYGDGLKPGDKVDLTFTLYLNSGIPGGLVSETEMGPFTGEIKDVLIKKRRIASDRIRSHDLYYYRAYSFFEYLKEKRVPAVYNGFGKLYFAFTDSGLNKLGDCSKDAYDLVYGEDMSLLFTGYIGDEDEPSDITEYFDIDLSGEIFTFNFEDYYYLSNDLCEVQEGMKAGQFWDIAKKHTRLYKNGEIQKIDTSKLEFTSIHIYNELSSNEIAPDDDEALNKILAKKGNTFTISFKLEVDKKDGEPVYQFGGTEIVVRKNSYNIYLDTFEEVAHATGASYENTKHDFMVNFYALKNESEKIRVGSLGDSERFNVYIYDNDGYYLSTSEKEACFSKLRGGDRVYYQAFWSIPISEEDKVERDEDTIDYWWDSALKFYAYDASKDLGNPGSDAHKTDGQSIDKLPEGAPVYQFKADSYNTLVAGVKVNIADKFKSYVSMNGYLESAKHRYKVDNKKIAKVDKKGNVVPKKSGTIKVTLEQKEKGSGWKQIGDPIELYVQVPEMKKDVEAAVGEKLNARDFIGKTTFAPTSWKSSKPAIAEVNPETGEITIKKKGKVKIIAVYGEGKQSSKNKYKTKLKVKG